jgi:hypothetical protein
LQSSRNASWVDYGEVDVNKGNTGIVKWLVYAIDEFNTFYVSNETCLLPILTSSCMNAPWILQWKQQYTTHFNIKIAKYLSVYRINRYEYMFVQLLRYTNDFHSK